jgi:formylglycine-generating enzyme required for sulfatase activity
MKKKYSCICLVFFVISMLLTPTLHSQQARVKGILDTGILINPGSKAGVKIGLTGRIYYQVTISGQKKSIFIAKFVITKVNQDSSEARITEKTGEVKLGHLVHFDQKIVPPQHNGKLIIDSNPPGAAVYINGSKQGNTPLSLSLKPGPYSLRISKSGYNEASEQITIKSAQTFRKEFKLTSTLPSYISLIKSRAKKVYKNQQGYWEAEFDYDIVMIYIPGGEFSMGSNEGQKDEKPIHSVFLDGYWIGKYEVTQGQWEEIMGSNPSRFKNGDNYPVERVSWNDVQQFIQKLNSRTGLSFRLPGEAEWEKAARGTDRRKYPWGNASPSCSLANYSPCGGQTKPVGSHPPGISPYGVHDMAGDVWEWCSDWYSSSYYSSSPQKKPTGPSSGSYRVFRGGSWLGSAWGLRCAYRGSYGPSNRFNNVGFRLRQD